MGAVLTNAIDDLLCHWIAVKEPRNGGLAKAGFKVSGSDVVPCRIKGSSLGDCETRATSRTARSDLYIHVQGGANIDNAPLDMSLPRVDNPPGCRSVGHGAREEDRE